MLGRPHRWLLETSRKGAAVDAVSLGKDAGAELLRRAGPGYFESET